MVKGHETVSTPGSLTNIEMAPGQPDKNYFLSFVRFVYLKGKYNDLQISVGKFQGKILFDLLKFQ